MVNIERQKNLRGILRQHGLAWWLASTALTLAPQAQGAELEVPLVLDYRILQQALQQQLFTGPGQQIEVYADRIRCNTLVLGQPRAGGTSTGQVRILTAITAHTGTPLGQRCLLARSWHGVIETLHEAFIGSTGSTVAFKVVGSDILRQDTSESVVPRVMQKWIRQYIHPRLDAIVIDLGPALNGMRELFGSVVGADGYDVPALVASLRLKAVRPGPSSLDVALALEVPAAPPQAQSVAEAPLSAQELAHWDETWQAWDAFATWLIKASAANAAPELADALADTLLEARYELREALERDDRNRDPVRELFRSSWARLAPLLRESPPEIPGASALQLAAFIGAADALLALDRIAPYLGVRLDRDGLRRLARMLIPAVTDNELAYGTAIDPELRQLLGLEPGFDGGQAVSALLDWLVPSAQAADIETSLAEQLNRWVPGPGETDRYLATVARLLEAISLAEHGKGKVPPGFFAIYDTLLLATAWQESCWRQYIRSAGEVQVIQSTAGSVGMMQVNKHVWRGVYDLSTLTEDIGYNARAGNEILVHYLVDYAIRKGEHERTGDANDLARAAYTTYNGGPAHLGRYRRADTSESLRHIDNAFWQKYQAVQQLGAAAVKQCYGN
jgi:hypothetical protein